MSETIDLMKALTESLKGGDSQRHGVGDKAREPSPPVVIEPAGCDLRNALQICQNFMDELPHMSEQSIASHAADDIAAIRDRIQIALDKIESVKAACQPEVVGATYSNKSRAIARVRAWL